MRKIWNYISAKGKVVISKRQMIAGLALIFGVFHAASLVFFGFLGIYPMVALNLLSVVIYWFCYKIAAKDISLLAVFNTIYIEVIFYSVIAAFLLGNNSGFTLYLITIIPFGYYVAYLFREENVNINPMIYVMSAVAAFGVTRILSEFAGQKYMPENAFVERMIYAVNYIAMVTVVILFCSTLVIRIMVLEERQKAQNEVLEELSKSDPLTGLSNRRRIQERYELSQLLKEGYAIILGDIDDFKNINDTYGHNVGDEVLKVVADIFKTAAGSDDVVCRWGGEEILVFLPKASKEQSIVVAQRILDKIRDIDMTAENKEKISVTMTLGIAVSDEAGEFNEVAKKADKRMYAGKHIGKNVIISK